MASASHEISSASSPIKNNSISSATKNSTRPVLKNTCAPISPLQSDAVDSTSVRSVLKQDPSVRFQRPLLTGAAALADEHRAQTMSAASSTTPNPAATAVKALMPEQHQGTSKPESSVHPTTQITDTEGISMPITDEPMQIDQGQNDVSESPHNVHDPRLTEADDNVTVSSANLEEQHEERSNKAHTYPPRPDQMDLIDTPTRGMSLPNATSKSPGSKKHKCHHCGTEFTRHHNLKSHLLTHSHEKPFCCDKCDQKFRRLHDLKRHTKLHTGERPHTCPKCGRAFARGDALARHNKGPGGCAGRRGSGGEDDLEGMNGDEGMDGVVYDQNVDSQNGSKRRKSEQAHNRKRSFQSTMGSSPYRQHSSTYPGPAPMMGTHSQGHLNGSSPATHLSPRMNNGLSQFPSQLNAPQSVFSQGGMTESPKPLSPGAEQARRLSAGLSYSSRARSPSFVQQQQMSRGPGQNSPSVAGISGTPSQNILPSLGSLTTESQKSSLPSSINGTVGAHSGRLPPNISTSHPLIQAGPNSAGSTNPPSASSQHRSSGGSMREILNPKLSSDRSNEYIRKAEADQEIQRVRDELSTRLQEYENMVRALQEENKVLKATAAGRATHQPSQPEAMPASH